MKIYHAHNAPGGFTVLETTTRSQQAFMVLHAGESSSDQPGVHATSDQTLVVMKGCLLGSINGQISTLEEGDAITVAANTPHTFTNPGPGKAVTFNVYSPPAYPAGGV